MPGKIYPGDVANRFIRCLLSDIGELLGGFTESDWKATLEHFDSSCAYTGISLDKEDLVMDHIIPLNKATCGLHMYGNIVPATKEANSLKSNQDFKYFLRKDTACLGALDEQTRESRIKKIEDFIDKSNYEQRIAELNNLQLYCSTQYNMIKFLCDTNKQYFSKILKKNITSNRYYVNEATEEQLIEDDDPLLIEFEIQPINQFKTYLLRNKIVYITEYYKNGEKIIKQWNAEKMCESSNVIGNLRSKTNYRNPRWRELGIVKLYVSINKPE